MGRMCSEVGWKHFETIKTLEEKRKVKAGAYWAKKKEMIQVSPTPLFACSVGFMHHFVHGVGNFRAALQKHCTACSSDDVSISLS